MQISLFKNVTLQLVSRKPRQFYHQTPFNINFSYRSEKQNWEKPNPVGSLSSKKKTQEHFALLFLQKQEQTNTRNSTQCCPTSRNPMKSENSEIVINNFLLNQNIQFWSFFRKNYELLPNIFLKKEEDQKALVSFCFIDVVHAMILQI